MSSTLGQITPLSYQRAVRINSQERPPLKDNTRLCCVEKKTKGAGNKQSISYFHQLFLLLRVRAKSARFFVCVPVFSIFFADIDSYILHLLGRQRLT